MLKVIIPKKRNNEVDLKDVPEDVPIFVKRNGKFHGMIVREEKGWIIKIGGSCGDSGHHPSRLDCMEAAYLFDNFEFFVEGND